ncbi:MAG: hypothetical protein R2711_12635 [Acidimicrobiales bacterium]
MIVSSHVLDEVEWFGSRILVVAQGRPQGHGRLPRHPRPHGRPPPPHPRTDRPRELATEVMRSVGVQAVELEPEAPGRPGGFVVETTDAPRFRRAIATASQGVGASLLEVTPLDDDLDSVFRYLVGR